MEKVSYITYAIPVFFILIGVELLVAALQKKKLYRLNDSINNLNLGIGSQVVGVIMKGVFAFGYAYLGVFAFGYAYLYDNYRLVEDIGKAAWVWVVLFVGVDFFYYWFHRMSHEINALWAAHIVHHQSEEYNLSVALRQSWFQGWFSWAFYLPLAIIGFDPIMFAALNSFNTLYQFWIHTRIIGKMGPFEWIFNTPSHHRVHHGSNPKYIDKNHAGTLIIWDRLFGTFQEEEEEPVYGITSPLNSWNPVWANFHYWVDLGSTAKKTKGLWNKILVFIKPPGWFPKELGGYQQPKEIDLNAYTKYDADNNRRIDTYAFFQFVFTLLAATGILLAYKEMVPLQLAASSIFILLCILNLGALFERKPWAYLSEFFRILFGLFVVSLFSSISQFYYLLAFAVVYSFLSFIWFYLASKPTEEVSLTP